MFLPQDIIRIKEGRKEGERLVYVVREREGGGYFYIYIYICIYMYIYKERERDMRHAYRVIRYP
jgi:hypothetical protein